MGVRIISTSSYIPDEVISNTDWENTLDTTNDWIVKRTGIQQRHWAKNEQTSDLCIRAAQKACSQAAISVEDIGLIIVATMTANQSSPSMACYVQEAIGASQAYAFDLNAACSGFVFALHTGIQLVEAANYRYAMIIGADAMLSAVDWSDRTTAILFGDGAGAVIIEKTSDARGLLGAHLKSNGALKHELTASSGQFLKMNGRAIFDLVTRQVPLSIEEACKQAGVSVDDMDYFVLHQANARLIEVVAKKLRQPIEKFPMNIHQYGNTSAASIPIVLDELFQKKRIKKGQKLVLSGFGGGLSWGSLVINL